MGLLSSLFGSGKRAASQPAAAGPAEVYARLRNHLLDIRLSDESSDVTAILMETGYAKFIVTLAAISDGTTSLYFSNGGAIIGGGEHESVRAASSALLQLAPRYVDHMQEANEFPPPAEAYVRFYLIKPGCVLTVDSLERNLESGESPLSPLFHQGHQVIAAIREHSPK